MKWFKDTSILKKGDVLLVAWPWQSRFNFRIATIIQGYGKLVVYYHYDGLTSTFEEYFGDDDFFHVLNGNLKFKQVDDHWEINNGS